MIVRQIIPDRFYTVNDVYNVFSPLKKELEFALEEVRRKEYNQYPSRLFGTFVFPDHDLYESLWRPKLHVDNGYTLLRHETQESLMWFNAYILDEANQTNLIEISHKYWESAQKDYDAQDPGFLCESCCTQDLRIVEVFVKE